MQGLWADGWFYLSAASLLVSGVLFFFLLGQYRAAAEAADHAEPEGESHAVAPAPVAVRPVYIPDEDEAPAPKVASAPAEKKTEPAPKPAEAPAAETPERPRDRRENTTGGLSPAVLYLQSIKTQLDQLNGAIGELTKRVDAVSGRDEALIERLGDLTQQVAQLKDASSQAPAEEPAPAPKRAKKEAKPAPAPEPAAVDLSAAVAAEPKPEPKPEPAPEPKTQPVAEAKAAPDETVRLQLDQVIEAQMADKPGKKIPPPPMELTMPAESASAEPEAEDKPKRGPVWPV